MRLRVAALAMCLAGGLAPLSSVANAEEVPPEVISQLRIEPDPNGVNLLTGRKDVGMPVVLSVPAAPRLKFDKVQNSAPYITGGGSGSTETMTKNESFSVHIGSGTSESFKCVDGECQSVTYSGSKLIGRLYTRAPGGEAYQFDLKHVDTTSGDKRQMQYYASAAGYPDGEVISYTYGTGFLPGDTLNRTFYRPTRIDSKTGYYITISYQYTGGDVSVTGWGDPAEAAIYSPSGVLIRRLVYNSDGTIVDYGNSTTGRTFTSSVANGLGASLETNNAIIKLPGEASNHLTVNRASNDGSVTDRFIGSIVRDGVQWNYSYTNPRLYKTLIGDSEYTSIVYDAVTATGSNGYSVRYDMAPESGFSTQNPYRNIMKSRTDALGRKTSYAHDGERGDRLIKITLPEGNYVGIGYDDCGNLTTKTTVPKPNSGLTTITESAEYPIGQPGDPAYLLCPDVRAYRPTKSTDALGRVTNYEHNDKGQLTKQLDPPVSGSIRRQADIEYTLSTNGISRKTLVRVCGGTSCSGSAESRIEYTYWGETNLPLTETQVDEATGARRITTYRYDAAGRVAMIDGPLGTGSETTYDAQYFRYDTYGRKAWEIGPRGPNGGRRLTKEFFYRNSDDKPYRVINGSVACDTDCDTVSLSRVAVNVIDTTYDSRRYPVRQRTFKGTTTYAVTDRSFLNRGLNDCTTVRMNLASLPAATSTGACTLGTQGTEGPDRITKNTYDSAGQLTKVQKAFGTADQADYVTYTYTANGKQQYVTDANSNKAQFQYDGHDRLYRWYFPSKTTKGAVNTADYEQYGYDAAGNRTSLRKRDASTLTYSFDGLNRMTLKVVPSRTGLTAAQTRDVYFGYDIMGRQLTAKFDSATGADGVTNSYNGFGDATSSQLTIGTFSRKLTSAYDGAGRRTQLTHPDSKAFTYTYDPLSRLSGVYQGAGTTTVLDTFAYDYYGRLGKRSEGAGSSVSYTWDWVARLTKQTDAFSDAVNNVEWTFTTSTGEPGYNPASQLTIESRNNDNYAWTGAVNVNRGYAVNGLNQYTSAGPASFTYDANGNLTSDGTNTYTYDVENRLVKAVAGSTTTNLTYDPLGRLFQVDKGTSSTTTRFLYDGNALVLEFNSSNGITNRYIHGSNAAADDPLVWYEGATLSYKRWLHADRLGSIVAVTHKSLAGSSPSINSYDEYGIPASTNTGRFQYTAQAWIGELAMYYYKARIYSPRLGRFLQTDPVGYDDQINLYAYVGNDPVNNVDPDGKVLVNVGLFFAGAGADVAVQVFVEGKSFDDVNLTRAGMSGLQTAVGLGALRQGITAVRTIRAAKQAQSAARTARQNAKLTTSKSGQQRAARTEAARTQNAARDAKTAAVRASTRGAIAVGGGEAAKKAAPPITVKDVEDRIRE